jgi:hypothetical protein
MGLQWYIEHRRASKMEINTKIDITYQKYGKSGSTRKSIEESRSFGMYYRFLAD